jgi:WD40 repeat protein
MKTRIITALVSSLFLLSCTTRIGVSPTITETAVYATSTPKQTTVVEVTRIPAPASTNSNTTADIPMCPKSGVEIVPSDNFGIPGTLVFQKDFHGLYTVGGSPLIYATLPIDENEQITSLGFSPDGQWLAFSPLEFSSNGEPIFKTAQVILLSANGERIEQTLSVEQFSNELQVAHVLQGFSGYSHWINNTTIYATLYSVNPDPNTTRYINDLPKVIDPFAGVWREDLLKGLPERSNAYAKGISPDLTRMLYLSGEGLFLKDLEKGIDIWHDKDLFAGFGALMFWSPDSKTVAYANLFDSPEDRTVVLISRDGVAKTIMGNTVSLSELLVLNLQWSPDGRYLALLLWKGEGEELSVFIYDFEAEKYISQCPIAKYTSRGPDLFWSPDNKYLAYGAFDYPLVIMNVQSGEIIRLTEKANAVGWSDEFPVIWHQH